MLGYRDPGGSNRLVCPENSSDLGVPILCSHMSAFNLPLCSTCLSILKHHSLPFRHTSLLFVVVNVRLFPALKRVAARRSLRSREHYLYYYKVCIVLIESDSSLLACGISTQCNIIAYFLASCSGERAPVSSIEMCRCPQKPEKSRTLPILPQGTSHHWF
jgi:hypothetical protein